MRVAFDIMHDYINDSLMSRYDDLFWWRLYFYRGKLYSMPTLWDNYETT